jgi:hypothetical protein
MIDGVTYLHVKVGEGGRGGGGQGGDGLQGAAAVGQGGGGPRPAQRLGSQGGRETCESRAGNGARAARPLAPRPQDGGVQLVACTRDNVSPSFVLEFLKRISVIIKVGPWEVGWRWGWGPWG